MVFILQFVDVVYHTDWLVNVEKFLYPGIKTTWSFCMITIPLTYYWIQVVGNLLRIFVSIFHQWYWPITIFFCSIFVWFCYQVHGGLIEWVWEHSSLCNFLSSFRKICVNSWNSILGSFLITFSISVLVIGLFIFSICSWFNL